MSKRPTGKDGGPRKRQQGALTTEQRAIRALRELEGLAKAIGRELGLSSRHQLPVDELIVPVTVRLDARQPPDGAAGRLVEALHERMGEALKAVVAFRPGHVYCFQCDEPACAHTRPPEPADVFVGYTPTGRPAWRGFANVCLSRREDRVDRLYGEAPEVLVLAQTAAELTGELLAGFGAGSLAYRVLGQVSAGLVPRDFDLTRAQGERVALTLQLVETASGYEGRRLRLNLVGMTRDELAEAAAGGDAKGPAEALRRVLGATEQRMGALGRRANEAERAGAPIELAAEIEPTLARLRSEVARLLKPARHRTQHAQTRHRSGERPTSSAVRDARRASEHELLEDVRRDTVVVLGPKGRAHVFTRDGKHVTSLQLKPGEVAKKTGQERWRAMARGGIDAFRSKLPAE